jgi:hypothetical protein
MEACYGGTDVMERSCAVARGKDINNNTYTGNAISGSGRTRHWHNINSSINTGVSYET